MTRKDETQPNLNDWFSDMANIAILLVILVAIAASVVGLWRSQRGFFLSGLGALVFVVILNYADAGRFSAPQSSQVGAPPLGLAKGSVRAIMAFALIAGFGLYIYYATIIGGEPDEKVFTALSSIISAVVGFYFGSRTTAAAEPITGATSPTVTGIDPNKAKIGANIDISNLAGSNFQQGATVSLVRGDEQMLAKSVNVAHSSKITCSFDLSQTTNPGKWNVVVSNPGGQAGSLPEGFLVE